jgi:photosystem II stability/assembly factor-like uncharacterized protein
MKKKYLSLMALIVVVLAIFYVSNKKETVKKDVEDLRAQHQYFLDHSPYKQFKELSRKERKALGLPPNAYNEQMWELTLDPQVGRPMYENTFALQQQLREESRFENEENQTRGVGGDISNPWIDRGPNNIGGRTRGIMFDPNDTTDYNRVFAGGVSGGLWVNDDITDPNSSWSLVPGLAANIAVTVIIHDPNNPNIFYIGAGESYTSGRAIGNGIWKSTDGGVTWANIFGGYTGISNSNQQIDGIFYINDIVARDVGATTELYIAVAGAYYGESGGSPNQWHSLSEQGVYKSSDNGSTWSRFAINEIGGTFSNPSDLEIDINNNIWLSTTNSSWGFPGGKILRSTDGLSFSLMHTVPNARRTEIECSQNNANTLWVAAAIGTTNNVDLFTTTDAFTTVNPMASEPNDADPGIPSTDFTRGQAWYDLEIEADANDNLIVGGVDLFRSTNNGTSWSQISEWYDIGGLTASFVHADQQAIVFRPGAGNENKVVFGTDGGLFYCDNITTAAGSASAISARNKDYNTVQFYYGDISSVINGAADDLIGGTQDNGTPAAYDAAAGANGFTDITGGDGGYTEVDNNGNYIITSYPTNNHYVITSGSQFYRISSNTGGSFINQAELDDNLDILYSNSTNNGVFGIERNSNLLNGSINVQRTNLTDVLLNAAPSAFKVSPFTTGSTKLFAGLVNGRLLRLDNADTTPVWNNITGTGFVGSISDIEFGQSESEIFVTMHNYGVTSIWFTNDGGTTWQNKEGDLPDIPVKSILQNPLIANEVIIGTQLGVWATANYTSSNPTWVRTNNGMSEVPVLDLDLRNSDNTILATTHGRGFFTSQFTAVSLSENESNLIESGVKVYPTVSNGEIHIKTAFNFGEMQLEVYNISGQKVFNTTVNANNNVTPLSLSLNSGIYLMKFKSDNSEITKKIVIK